MQFVKQSWLSTIVLAAALSGGYLYAQLGMVNQPPTNGTPHRTMEAVSELRMLDQELKLTPEQREKLRPVLAEEGQQLHDVRIDEHIPPDAKRARLIEVREKFAPKVAAELTPEQLPKFKKLHESLTGKPYDAPKDTPAPPAHSK